MLPKLTKQYNIAYQKQIRFIHHTLKYTSFRCIFKNFFRCKEIFKHSKIIFFFFSLICRKTNFKGIFIFIFENIFNCEICNFIFFFLCVGTKLSV